jgi:hypothetical protein
MPSELAIRHKWSGRIRNVWITSFFEGSPGSRARGSWKSAMARSDVTPQLKGHSDSMRRVQSVPAVSMHSRNSESLAQLCFVRFLPFILCAGVATCSRRKSDRSNGNFGAFEWDGSRRESAASTPQQVGMVAENSENCCLRLKGDDHLRPQRPMEFQKRLPIRSLLKSSGMPVQRPFAIPPKVVAWRSTSRWARPTRRKVRPAGIPRIPVFPSIPVFLPTT